MAQNRLEGRCVVITGAAAGLGEALARQCAAEGGNIMVVDIDGDAADRVAEELCEGGVRALAFQGDIACADTMAALAEECRLHFGGCDFLINNAGIAICRPLVDCDARDWARILSVNLVGLVNCTAAFIPMMSGAGRGHIVNIASMAGLVPLPGFGIYSASKHAVVGYSEVLAEELASRGIDVSIVCPGWIATTIQDKTDTDQPPIMDPELCRVIAAEEAAEIILSGMLDRRRHIATHAEWLTPVSERHTMIAQAFADAPPCHGENND